MCHRVSDSTKPRLGFSCQLRKTNKQKLKMNLVDSHFVLSITASLKCAV